MNRWVEIFETSQTGYDPTPSSLQNFDAVESVGHEVESGLKNFK